MHLRFQECTTSDLDELVEISRKTFVEAFERDNNPEDFGAYISMAFDKSNLELQLRNTASTFYFVFKSKVLVGYCKLNVGGAQTELKSEESLELERIYVLKQFQGRGIGSQIVQQVMGLAAQKQKRFVWLGVWQKNEDAIRFYQRYGFVKFGTHPYYIGKDKQTDWLMRLDLINFRNR